MRTLILCVVMALRPIIGIALVMLLGYTFLNMTLPTSRDVVWSLMVGVVAFVIIEGFGFLMTWWYSLRHGYIPEGATRDPIDEFDVFY